MQELDEPFAARVQKAITPCSAKAFWQDMEHEQVEKILSGDGLCLVLPRFGMEVSLGDHGIGALQNTLFTNNASIQIPAEINDGLVAIADVFAVNNPLLWTTLWQL